MNIRLILPALLSAFMLAACGGSSSGGGSSNGNDDESETPDPSDDEVSVGDETVAEGGVSRALFYASEIVDLTVVADTRNRLHVVNSSDPEEASIITPVRQDNARARSDQDIFRSTGVENHADPSTLPLGLKSGDWDEGTLTNVRYGHVIYNSEDGELFSVPVDDNDFSPDAERLSSETQAEVVCAARAFADYEDPERSAVVYQAARDGNNCEDTTWKMVRLDFSEDDSPIVLRDRVRYPDGFAPDDDEAKPEGLREHWAIPVRNPDGGLVSILTFDGDDAGDLLWHDVEDGEDEILASEDGWVRPLGVAGEDLVTIIHVGGEVLGLDISNDVSGNARFIGMDIAEEVDPGEVAPFNPIRVEPSLTGPEQAVVIDGLLYVLDIEDGENDSGRLLIINPDADTERASVAADDWGTGCQVTNVVGTTSGPGYVAWVYANDCDAGSSSGTIRHVELNAPSSSAELVSGLNLDYTTPITSPTAPGTSTPLIFYNRGTRSWAGAVDITGNGEGYELDSAAWVGQTWSRIQPTSGPQAEYLFYLEDDEDSNSILKARPATDLTGEEVVVFENAPDPLVVNRAFGNVFVQSYGPVTLLGIRPSILEPDPTNNLRGTIWVADPRNPASMEDIVYEIERSARPVSFF